MRKILTGICMAALCLAVPVQAGAAQTDAYVPYDTYVYDYHGDPVVIPHAYIPENILVSGDMGTEPLAAPSDVVTDGAGTIYIADTGNNRIVVLNKDFQFERELTGFTADGVEETFSEPRGLFVAEDGSLYVADTGNGRIVQFTGSLEYVRTIGAPVTTLLPEDFVYQPKALAVDASGNLYVVAIDANMGLIRFSPDGKFSGFMGAPSVSYNPIEYLWKNFLSQEQRDRMSAFVSTEYNNVCLDSRGFLYVTTSAVEEEDFLEAINTRGSSGKGLPVRCLNPMGKDVLRREGFYPPIGDLNYEEPSVIEDVAVAPNGTYTIMDSRRCRLFTYSQNGDLLYTFSAKGEQAGNTMLPSSICYYGNKLLLLDSQAGTLTVFARTAYGDSINKAVELYADFRYDESSEVWKQVLSENANMDVAYDGLGNAEMRLENYGAALQYFENSNNTYSYSQAFKEYRSEFIEKHALLVPAILVGVIALLIGLFYLVRYMMRKPGLVGTCFYGFHIMTHPFSGFWDMKHEKRGSMLGAAITLALALLAIVGRSCLVNPLFSDGAGINPLAEIAVILLPILLWAVVNWSVTTLMDGKGTIKDIFMFTAYAALPVFLLMLPIIPLSYVLVLEEGMYLTLLSTVAFLWAGGLIFCGNLTIHDYSAKKNIASILLTILGMAIALFVLLMIFMMYQKMAVFGDNLVKEITYRR